MKWSGWRWLTTIAASVLGLRLAEDALERAVPQVEQDARGSVS